MKTVRDSPKDDGDQILLSDLLGANLSLWVKARLPILCINELRVLSRVYGTLDTNNDCCGV